MYNVHFKVLDGQTHKWEVVGPEWLNCDDNIGEMIKLVCGCYPSRWDGAPCWDLYFKLDKGARNLKQLACDAPKGGRTPGRSLMQRTIEFLEKLKTYCEQYPRAYVFIDVE